MSLISFLDDISSLKELLLKIKEAKGKNAHFLSYSIDGGWLDEDGALTHK